MPPAARITDVFTCPVPLHVGGAITVGGVVSVLGVLCIIGIIYGALVAWVQRDIKKLVAYSSVSHLGFCVLGLLALTRPWPRSVSSLSLLLSRASII